MKKIFAHNSSPTGNRLSVKIFLQFMVDCVKAEIFVAKGYWYVVKKALRYISSNCNGVIIDFFVRYFRYGSL